MTWTVEIRKRASKAIPKLPNKIRNALFALLQEIEKDGPVRGNWSNYGKLSPTKHHCHLKRGNPTFVAVWEVTDKEIRIVEVIYAGTHEKAPY